VRKQAARRMVIGIFCYLHVGARIDSMISHTVATTKRLERFFSRNSYLVQYNVGHDTYGSARNNRSTGLHVAAACRSDCSFDPDKLIARRCSLFCPRDAFEWNRPRRSIVDTLAQAFFTLPFRAND